MYKIMQHCFGGVGTGGPVIAFERFLAHSDIRYRQIRQVAAAGGINFPLIVRFIKEIRADRPDLIHVRGLGNEGFHAVLAARIAGVPRILLSIHGTCRDVSSPQNRVKNMIVSYMLEPLSMCMATHIATVCDAMIHRDFMAPHAGKVMGSVPNGVDLPLLAMSGSPGLRSRWGISDKSLIGICVSRVTVDKGYFVLAEALLRIDDNVSDLAIFIVGGGDHDGIIKRKFNSLKNIKIIFTGHRDDVADFLKASDFFIFPTLHENLSNALIEAMSHGLPVIATNVGGNIEVVSKGGGVLVDVGDAPALADAILNFIVDKDSLPCVGQNARENVECNYSLTAMVSGWEELYARILRGGISNG